MGFTVGAKTQMLPTMVKKKEKIKQLTIVSKFILFEKFIFRLSHAEANASALSTQIIESKI